ncbi:uncharacterized protein LOC122197436 [Lactuca sativa]|uniref:uncharacterized protein LOC122197436 n=1 Tax=Lactuca sativa TaxID=4236 RepID=UPI001C68D812|nr:uncharacterized protein LOC122197436 [Lactuca sativa]
MAAVAPPREKKTPNPRRTIYRHPKEINDDDPIFPLYFLIMIPNTIGMFSRAYRRNDYSLAILSLLDWENMKSGEHGIGLLGNQRLDARELKNDSDSVLEKV